MYTTASRLDMQAAMRLQCRTDALITGRQHVGRSASRQVELMLRRGLAISTFFADLISSLSSSQPSRHDNKRHNISL